MTTIPVILCGGSGTRLWPISREQKPKQFLKLMDNRSLLQNTVLRAQSMTGAKGDEVVTVTLAAMIDEIRRQYEELEPSLCRHILGEPEARNTAAAVVLAAIYVEKTFGPDAVMWVLPSDHHIGDERALARSFEQARQAARQGYLVAFGIRPSRPETGYGYIKAGEALKEDTAHKIEKFVEKPDVATALQYLNSGDYLWNSGMFVFTAKAVLDAFKSLSPEIYDTVKLACREEAGHITELDPALYAKAQSTPFDIAIMEKTDKAAVVKANPAWSDIGSWESLREIGEQDANGNVTKGQRVYLNNCEKTIVHAEKRLVACVGLNNIVVAETSDAVLVADQRDGASLKALINELKAHGTAELFKLAGEK
ncbi:MAG: NTP transferase domain-containing protein [Rhodospirillales bacterium]|nr:NTP transferase domain-containing protein [Rhodospirillales bacterium]